MLVGRRQIGTLPEAGEAVRAMHGMASRGHSRSGNAAFAAAA
jgi:hypothetical protein